MVPTRGTAAATQAGDADAGAVRAASAGRAPAPAQRMVPPDVTGAGRRLRPRQCGRAAEGVRAVARSVRPDPRVPAVSDSPWPEQPQAHRGLRAGTGPRRPAQRAIAMRATRAAGCSRSTASASARAGRRRRLRVLVVRHRSVGARGPVHARERTAVHPESAAAVSERRQTPPRLRVRVRAAVAARPDHGGAGARRS